jgi:ABC-type amino acid transport substrate-binding protein
MGREVTFRPGAWADVKGWLERGEVQVLPLAGRTPEREAVFDFTVPYLTMHGAIVVRQETKGIADLNDLRGRRVAVMKTAGSTSWPPGRSRMRSTPCLPGVVMLSLSSDWWLRDSSRSTA